MTIHPHEISRIVAGMDEGKLALPAIETAMNLAELFDARLDVLHAVGIDPPLRGNASAEHWAAASAKALSTARSRCVGTLSLVVEHPRYADSPVGDYLSVVPDKPVRALLKHARETQADLIVLGAHHRRKLFDFGGTARGVLAGSPCPVWVQPCPVQRIGMILVPIDLSESSELVLRMASTLAMRMDARLRILHAFQPPPFAYDEEAHRAVGPSYVVDDHRDSDRAEFEAFVERFSWIGARPETAFVEGDPAEEILAHQGDVDLIVMGTHGRSGLARAVLGSQAYRVLKGAECAVLAVPQPAREHLSAHESATG